MMRKCVASTHQLTAMAIYSAS